MLLMFFSYLISFFMLVLFSLIQNSVQNFIFSQNPFQSNQKYASNVYSFLSLNVRRGLHLSFEFLMLPYQQKLLMWSLGNLMTNREHVKIIVIFMILLAFIKIYCHGCILNILYCSAQIPVLKTAFLKPISDPGRV